MKSLEDHTIKAWATVHEEGKYSVQQKAETTYLFNIKKIDKLYCLFVISCVSLKTYDIMFLKKLFAIGKCSKFVGKKKSRCVHGSCDYDPNFRSKENKRGGE